MANLVERLRGSVDDADGDIADALVDAQTTGDNVDPDDWHVEVPVNWLRECIAALEAEASKGERRGLERAIALVERGEFDSSVGLDPKQDKSLSDWFRRQQVAALRALIPEAPVQEADPKDDPRYPALLADAKARGRNENLDGSPRRHASTTPPQDNREG